MKCTLVCDASTYILLSFFCACFAVIDKCWVIEKTWIRKLLLNYTLIVIVLVQTANSWNGNNLLTVHTVYILTCMHMWMATLCMYIV